MDKQAVEALLATFKGAEASYPFGPEALVYKVMGKMYALVSQQEAVPRVTLKVNPPDGAALIDLYSAITPGYYMNKKHWISLSLNGEVPETLVQELAEKSYALVVAKLTKKERQQLEG